jgi:hypothetical protein
LAKAIPHGRVFCNLFSYKPSGGLLDKVQKEALQAAKEMLAKFIETRTVSPNTFADVFPAVYKVICDTLRRDASASRGAEQEDG